MVRQQQQNGIIAFVASIFGGGTLFILVPVLAAWALALVGQWLAVPLAGEQAASFQWLFGDAPFFRTVVSNSLFILVMVPGQLLLALASALLFAHHLRSWPLYRGPLLVFILLPFLLATLLWGAVFAPDPNTMMNSLMSLVAGSDWQARDFINDPLLALPAIMLTAIWQWMGFFVATLLVALQLIPEGFYEAAVIDGARRWQRFRYITLPRLRYSLIFVLVAMVVLAAKLLQQAEATISSDVTAANYEAVRLAFSHQQVDDSIIMIVALIAALLTITHLVRGIPGKAKKIGT
ncbi:MAG: sugar ABC transporter permease [Gammaproteobacteria bacterium]|nr:sugar ABC transporter permease [Gammaproteobacteria bacterium]